MKKLLFISLLTTLALCGCQKKELEYQPVGSIKFTATIEDDFGDTKTSLDGQGNVLWKKGNQVSIFNGSTINQQYQVTDASEGKTAAGLIPVSPAGFVAGGEIDNNVALYPYSSTAEIVKNEGAYVISGISLPATQNYAAGSFGDGAFPMTAVTSSVSDLNLKFKNILGCLKLQLKGTTSIASITVTGNNNEILCGAASVTAATGTVPSISLTDESAKTVTLNCGDGVALNTSTATPFVIALPPMTMTGGFTVIVRDTEGKEMEIKTTKSQTIIRSGILKMPEVNYEGTLKPFTITSSGSTSIAFCKEGEPDPITLQYRQGTEAWNAYTIGTIINLNDGESLQFRAGDGGNSTFSTNWDKQYYHIVASGEGTITASGNIMSLLDGNMTRSDVPSNGFTNLFYDCSKLTDASMLKLPATTLSENCYDNLFYGCTSLTQAPKLPATTLAKSCYFGMFRNCTSLTQAPELQATNLADQCYRSMFNSCTSLTQAPKLPATTLAENCYRAMFSGCLGLTIVPELPATTMASGSYISMFYGCLGLTIAPELPATTLAENCYQSMFEGCYSLTTAPNLPATTLAGYCYAGMFHGCRSLTKAPELPATTLEDGCYVDLFGGCSDLNYVKALFYTTPSDSYTKDWLSGVSSTGTFVKNYHATWDVTGTNGIPEGWTVEIDEDTKDYFTITSIGSTSVSISKVGTPNDITLEYRKGSGSWNAYTVGLGVDLSDGEMLQFRAGEGGNSTFSISNSKYYIVSIEGDGQVVVSGNIMSLLDKTLKKKDMPSYGFLRLFRDCEKITNAANLKLPATTLESSCYSNMFNGCTSLTQAPELPATTLANACYTSMFMGCTNLTQAPKLPATTLAISCYFGMFRGCTNLTQAPELPATTLVNGCYNNMFNGCTSLIQAPELPATTLANACYNNMFNGCTSLIQAPELPATTLESSCYSSMFSGCTSLTQAPVLPATTLKYLCYGNMFSGCTSLIQAPELPATVLKDNCYYNMFNGCSNLNYVKALFTTTPSDSYTKDWLAGVSSTGTFIKNGSATWDVTGVNGIPEGWTVEIDEDTKPYFTITSTGNTSVSISKVGTPNDITLEYRKGSGSWSAYTVGTGLDLSNKECLQFRAGEGGNDGFWKDSDKYYNVVIAGTGTVDVYGNIMSLLDNSLKTSSVPWHGFHNFFKGCTKLVSAYLLELPATTLANGCYSYMFSGCTSLTLAPELPAKIVPGYCYQYMFYGCTSLTKAPELPATSLGDDCYVEMFSGCTSLTTAPKLPATSLGYRCYQEMFKGCTSLTQAPAILATTLTDYCYSGMFLGCTALKQASELPATTLTSGCYSGMFNGCTSLTTTPELPATSLANYCYSGMFNGCTSLTTTPELPATTLAERCYSGMFDGCTSLTTAPELPATTLVDGCFCGMFQDCKKLNYVKALFTTTPSDTYTMSWLAGVSSTGIFVKSKDATWDVSGANGIPSGWTVQTE